MNKEPRLRFTDEERSDPALEKPIRKAEKAAARADKAQANIPKKKVRQTVIDPDTGKKTSKLTFEDKKKMCIRDSCLTCPAGTVLLKTPYRFFVRRRPPSSRVLHLIGDKTAYGWRWCDSAGPESRSPAVRLIQLRRG